MTVAAQNVDDERQSSILSRDSHGAVPVAGWDIKGAKPLPSQRRDSSIIRGAGFLNVKYTNRHSPATMLPGPLANSSSMGGPSTDARATFAAAQAKSFTPGSGGGIGKRKETAKGISAARQSNTTPDQIHAEWRSLGLHSP